MKPSDQPGTQVTGGLASKALPSKKGTYRIAADSSDQRVWLSQRASDDPGVCVTIASKESTLVVVNCVDASRVESQDLDVKYGEGAVSTTVRISARGSSSESTPPGFKIASENVFVKRAASPRVSTPTPDASAGEARRATRIEDVFYNGKIKQNTVINSPVRKKIIGAGTQAVADDSAHAYIASGIYYADAPQAVIINFSSRTASAACKWTYILPSYKVANPMKCVTYHY